MAELDTSQCTAFEGSKWIATGELAEVAVKAKAAIDHGATEPILIFDDETARVIEVDFRGSADDVRQRLNGGVVDGPTEAEGVKRPGRPKLGVIGREVTLLPRHWDWLIGQPGGASVALRKLVDEARRANQDMDRRRKACDTAYRFMAAMAGNYPGFEDASRALFAGDAQRFDASVSTWPTDIRDYTVKLAAGAF